MNGRGCSACAPFTYILHKYYIGNFGCMMMTYLSDWDCNMKPSCVLGTSRHLLLPLSTQLSWSHHKSAIMQTAHGLRVPSFLPITVVGEMRILAVLQISGIAVIRCPFLVEAVDVQSEMIKVNLVVDFALVSSSWPKLLSLGG